MRVVVVGGGFAGLYAAWLLVRAGHRVTLLEAAARCGGRARQIRFGARRWVAGGAGIGRLGKDRLLRRLLSAFRVPWRRFPRQVRYVAEKGGRPGSAEELAGLLRRLRAAGPRHTERFDAFVRRALGGDGAARFFALSGFGDDAAAGARDTLRLYGFGDNVGGGTGMSVPWNRLAAAMVRWLRGHPRARVLTSTRALRLAPPLPRAAAGGREGHRAAGGGGWSVLAAARRGRRLLLKCDRVLLALPASAMRQLAVGVVSASCAGLLGRVRAQSFAYVYARGSAAASRALPGYTVLTDGSPLQKMIPMGGRAFMVGYADNANARRLRRMGCAAAVRLAEAALAGAAGEADAAAAPSLFSASGCVLRWIAEGTHYFSPGKDGAGPLRASIRRSLPEGLHLAGEALSVGHQGWVEGALRDAADEVAYVLKDP